MKTEAIHLSSEVRALSFSFPLFLMCNVAYKDLHIQINARI